MIDIVSLLTNPTVIDSATKGLAITIGKTVAETGVKLLGNTGEKLWDETGKVTQKAKDLFFSISRQYIKNYAERHGTLKVLGMGKPVSLDSVYTQVNISAEITRYYQSIDKSEKGFRERTFREKQKRIGIEVANEEKYLMVLGNPGGGKTTFLRKVGLEALKGKKHGEYQHPCIPVLLELRKFRTGDINLVAEIAQEFANCGLPEYEKLTEEFLSKGRLLILLDGLDEVPHEQMSQMTSKIKDLRDKYAKNRFIASCRIAAYRHFESFRNFTDVVIADFTDEQVETFIEKWFESHEQLDWGKRCWQKLNSDEYQGTKELTKTPLLLTLICILFRKTGQFPTNRSTLYERTLRVLLEEWDATKKIPLLIPPQEIFNQWEKEQSHSPTPSHSHSHSPKPLLTPTPTPNHSPTPMPSSLPMPMPIPTPTPTPSSLPMPIPIPTPSPMPTPSRIKLVSTPSIISLNTQNGHKNSKFIKKSILIK